MGSCFAVLPPLSKYVAIQRTATQGNTTLRFGTGFILIDLAVHVQLNLIKTHHVCLLWNIRKPSATLDDRFQHKAYGTGLATLTPIL